MKDTSTAAPLLRRVSQTIIQERLLPAGGSVVVGVSGGPDSVCLLHMLRSLCTTEGSFPGISLHVAHLNHALRGEAGQADADFVVDLARQWGLPCTVGYEDVAALARAERRSLEDEARQARYRFLKQIASEVGAARIAVAHHADDQVETLVMHWLRGSGLAGLSGMQPLEGMVIRPLLGVRRAAILHYCEEQSLPFREDASNQDRRFTRNRIRYDLLPVLEQYNENLRETLLRTAALLAGEDAYIEDQLTFAWPDVICTEKPGSVEGVVSAYRALPLALRRRLLLRASGLTAGGQAQLEMRHVALCDAFLLQASSSGALDLPGGIRLRRLLAGHFLLERYADNVGQPVEVVTLPEHASIPLPVPGEAHLPGTRWRVLARVLERQHTPPPGYERGEPLRRRGYLDLEAAEQHGPLLLRMRKPGDRFRPLGMQREKKLQDVLVNARIPRAERSTLPLVCGADGMLLWVAGYQIADPVKLIEGTQRVLVLELVEQESMERLESASPYP